MKSCSAQSRSAQNTDYFWWGHRRSTKHSTEQRRRLLVLTRRRLIVHRRTQHRNFVGRRSDQPQRSRESIFTKTVWHRDRRRTDEIHPSDERGAAADTLVRLIEILPDGIRH